MKGYLLDTNICVFYFRGKYRLNEKLQSIFNCFDIYAKEKVNK